jgi:hypothetical protein
MPPAPTAPPPPRPSTTGAAPTGNGATRQPRKIEARQAKAMAPKIVYNAVSGFGKTTFAAFAPEPIILMAKGEAGYDTLLSAKRVPSVPAYTVDSWPDLLGWLDDLLIDPQGRRTIALDAMGGYERMCHEVVCTRDFKGNWDNFNGWDRGPKASIAEWLKLISRLEAVNQKHGTTIIFLSHAKPVKFKDPLAENYDRWSSDVNPATWAETHKWADAVLFGNFRTFSDKGKGVGGTDRIVCTEFRAGYDAKNRYGMKPEVQMGEDCAATWQTIWREMAGE